MRIVHDFELGFPADEAFERLLDVERVVPCLPGASLGERRADGAYALTLTTKLGPMRFTYEGEVRVTEVDAADRRAVLQGSARERRGQGNAEATIELLVAGDAAPAQVTATAEIALTGRAAQMGAGVIETVADQLIADMAKELERRAGDPAPAAAASPANAPPPARDREDAPPVSAHADDASPARNRDDRSSAARRADTAPAARNRDEALSIGRLLLALARGRLRAAWLRLRGASAGTRGR